MLFSVVTPTFNRIELLRGALESVWAQDLTDYELIVVDDGSTDSTVEYLRSLGSRVRLITQSNRGPGAARNLGAQHAVGDYLAFLDSDDVWFPWTLETYRQIILQGRPPAFVAGKPLRFENESALMSAHNRPLDTLTFADYYASGDEWRWWGASSFVVRRDAFQSVGGFTDEWVNGEDADLAMRLGVSTGFVQVTAPSTFAYREHPVSAMKDGNKTLAGAWHQVLAEQRGHYPGGSDRARERWRILTRHLRPVTLDCLRSGLRRDAWKLYRATFRWHVALGRWKFLAAFPLKAIFA